MSDRWTLNEMLILAAQGLGKIDRDGPRGATLVSQQEIEAMAGALAAFGLVPIQPGARIPETLIANLQEGAT